MIVEVVFFSIFGHFNSAVININSTIFIIGARYYLFTLQIDISILLVNYNFCNTLFELSNFII